MVSYYKKHSYVTEVPLVPTLVELSTPAVGLARDCHPRLLQRLLCGLGVAGLWASLGFSQCPRLCKEGLDLSSPH